MGIKILHRHVSVAIDLGQDVVVGRIVGDRVIGLTAHDLPELNAGGVTRVVVRASTHDITSDLGVKWIVEVAEKGRGVHVVVPTNALVAVEVVALSTRGERRDQLFVAVDQVVVSRESHPSKYAASKVVVGVLTPRRDETTTARLAMTAVLVVASLQVDAKVLQAGLLVGLLALRED